MILTIEIPCRDARELEKNLNRAIDDLGDALIKKGFGLMDLIAYDETVESEPIYKVTLKKSHEH